MCDSPAPRFALPRRSQAVLGLRLLALLVVCVSIGRGSAWMVEVARRMWMAPPHRAAVVGTIASALDNAAEAGRSRLFYTLPFVAFSAGATLLLSRGGVYWWLLRRFPR